MQHGWIYIHTLHLNVVLHPKCNWVRGISKSGFRVSLRRMYKFMMTAVSEYFEWAQTTGVHDSSRGVMYMQRRSQLLFDAYITLNYVYIIIEGVSLWGVGSLLCWLSSFLSGEPSGSFFIVSKCLNTSLFSWSNFVGSLCARCWADTQNAHTTVASPLQGNQSNGKE